MKQFVLEGPFDAEGATLYIKDVKASILELGLAERLLVRQDGARILIDGTDADFQALFRKLPA
jgi:hypothetical protein